PRVHLARSPNVHSFAQLLYHREHRLCSLIEQMDLLRETRYRQVLRRNPNPFTDFLHRLRYFIERSRERLNVFALQRSDKCFGQLFGEFLSDAFILTSALSERRQIGKGILIVDLGQEINEVMDAGVGLLRARFKQVVKSLVVPEKSADRKHNSNPVYSIAPRMINNAM